MYHDAVQAGKITRTVIPSLPEVSGKGVITEKPGDILRLPPESLWQLASEKTKPCKIPAHRRGRRTLLRCKNSEKIMNIGRDIER